MYVLCCVHQIMMHCIVCRVMFPRRTFPTGLWRFSCAQYSRDKDMEKVILYSPATVKNERH